MRGLKIDVNKTTDKNIMGLFCEVKFSTEKAILIVGSISYLIRQGIWTNKYDGKYDKFTTDLKLMVSFNKIFLSATNDTELKPVILKYTNPNNSEDIKYYLGFLFNNELGIRWNPFCFEGIINIPNSYMVASYVEYDGNILPEGYEIYQEPSPMRKLNLVSGYIGNDDSSYSYADIKALEDRISVLEKV